MLTDATLAAVAGELAFAVLFVALVLVAAGLVRNL
jgi:hypothetical protein